MTVVKLEAMDWKTVITMAPAPRMKPHISRNILGVIRFISVLISILQNSTDVSERKVACSQVSLTQNAPEV